MTRQKEVMSIGVCAVALALVLRLLSAVGILPLQNSTMLSFLPDFVTKDYIESGALCYLDVCDMQLEIWKQLIYHKHKWLSKSLKTVIDYIKAHEFSSET